MRNQFAGRIEQRNGLTWPYVKAGSPGIPQLSEFLTGKCPKLSSGVRLRLLSVKGKHL